MGFFDDKKDALTEEEIVYCRLLNETLDANQASIELKCKNAINTLERRRVFSRGLPQHSTSDLKLKKKFC